jgi:hypothetical protein
MTLSHTILVSECFTARWLSLHLLELRSKIFVGSITIDQRSETPDFLLKKAFLRADQ